MLSKFSVKRPYTVFVAIVLILILGTISFMNLQTDLLPSLDLPYVMVITPYPGASPEEVETIVTRPIEGTLATISNVEEINSISRENSSMVIIEFSDNVNMDSAIIEINGNMDMIKGSWNDSVGTPTIMRLNPDMLPVMISSVDIEGMSNYEVSQFVRENIIPELESVEGVASINGEGLVQESIHVELSSEKIENLNRRILENIDSELSNAENQLLEAKSEIDSGLSQLEAEQRNQTEELEEGILALQSAKTQITDGKAQLNTAKRDLEENRSQLESIIGIMDVAENQLQDLKSNMDDFSNTNAGRAELSEIITQFTSSLQSQVGEEDQDLSVIVESLIEIQENLDRAIVLRESHLINSIDEGLELLNQQKGDMESNLSAIDNGLKEIENQIVEVSTQENELQKQEQQLQQGRILLTTEMNNARTQLLEGQSTIDEQLKEMEGSKEEAFKNADLEGMITESMISGILTAQNFSMPAGYISDDDMEYLVKVGDAIQDEEEIGELLLFDTQTESLGKIYLKDVADIQNIDNSDTIYAKVNGNDAVALTFQKQSNYSTAEVSQNINEKIEEIINENPEITITNLMDQGIYIDIVVDSVLNNLIYGGILAVVILIIFLKDYKPTIIIGLSIPISLIFAIAMMYFTGVTINIISLGGLALGVGMLVDNSVVVIENIYRLKNEGLSAYQASIEGARQVSGALIASTLTTISVFLPIVFVQGISRQIFQDMGLTIAYSLIASLIMALTLVPVLSKRIFKNIKEKDHKFFDKIVYFYGVLLEKTLNHKFITISIVILLLGFSIFSISSMGTAFIPSMEGTEMSVTVEMEKGTTFEEITNMTDAVVDRMIEVEGIETIGAISTESMAMGSSNESMSLYVLLNENKSRTNESIAEEIKEATNNLDANIIVNTSTMDLGAIAGSGIEVNVQGNDFDILREISEDIADILKDIEGTSDIKTGFQEDSLEIRITVDKEKAMEHGLTTAQVYAYISQILSDGQTATTINMNNREYPVIVVNDKYASMTKDDLESLEIETENSNEEDQVTIGEISDITLEQSLLTINRNAQGRYVTVTSGLETGYNIGLVSRELENRLQDYTTPEGYEIEIAGETETINETLIDLLLMISLAIVFIYLIMVAQFQSLLSPFIVMFTIPLAFTGGILALLITGNEISVISMLGFLVLSGVVVNNGIVFVDYTNQLIESGMEKRQALIETGRVRMRPILMTAITTILGLSTLSFGVGMGAEMLQPLAIVAIGGLIYSTLLTLFIVPVMYDIFHRGRKVTPDGE